MSQSVPGAPGPPLTPAIRWPCFTTARLPRVVERAAVVADVDSAVVAPIQGTVVSIEVGPGDEVHRGQPLLVMEAMKMEHVIESTMSGIVRALTVSVGDTVFEGHPLVVVDADDVDRGAATVEEAVDLDRIRPDLAEALQRQGMTRDDVRPEAVAAPSRDRISAPRARTSTISAIPTRSSNGVHS